MKKQIKRPITIMLLLTLIFSSLSNTTFAKESDDLNSHRIHYIIYDCDGNIKNSGVLPMSEAEASARQTYPSHTLENGDSMILADSQGGGFYVTSGQHVYLRFGLNRNATVRSEIYDLTHSVTLSEKTGLTGGRSMSTPITRKARICGYITNYSSDPLTITWAEFEFN